MGMETGRRRRRVFLAAAALLTMAACARGPVTTGADIVVGAPEGVDLSLRAMALREVHELQSEGRRVWCVPFARNASGIDIRGDAHTWWASAKGLYDRGKEPRPGAVMVFSRGGNLSRGHVAVVSQVLSDREILIDHANWHRNKVSLGMSVIDISEAGDWSRVKVKSTEAAYGRPYAISGFIYPDRAGL